MINYTYLSTIKNLKKNPKAFEAFLLDLSSNPPANPQQILYLTRYMPPALRQNPTIEANMVKYVKINIDKILKTKYKWGAAGKPVGKMLKEFGDAFNRTERRKIMSKILPKMSQFYAYAKREVLETLVDWVEDEDTAIQIITKHHRLLSPAQAETVMKNVSKGWDNELVKKAFAQSLMTLTKKFKDADLKDKGVRKDFVNAIAQRPSLIRKVNKRIRLTLDDLNSLPPARRFTFLRELYRPIFRSYNLNTLLGIVRAFENAPNTKLVSIEPVPAEEMETLLFSLSIRKNDEVAKWFEKYKKFLINRDKMKKQIADIQRWL